MTELYINTPDKLEPGKIETGTVLNAQYEEVIVAIKCIRECSLQEYLDFVAKHNLSHRVRPNVSEMNFYLVEILD